MNRVVHIVSLLLCAGSARAALTAPVTITWGAQEPGGALGTSAGQPLPAGSRVRLGIFDIPAAEIAALAARPDVLESHFTILAEAAVGDFGGVAHFRSPQLSVPATSTGTPGAFAANLVLLPESLLNWNCPRVYLWAANAPEAAAASEIGIFSAAVWSLDGASFGNSVFDLSQVDPRDSDDVFLGTDGPETSALLGGRLRKLASVATLKADLSDDDHDGVAGLLEAAFGMNSSVTDAGRLPRAALMADGVVHRPQLTYFRRSGGATGADGAYTSQNLRYAVEVSPDLTLWSAAGSGASVSAIVPQPDGMEQVTVDIDPADFSAPCQFLRVRVSRVP